MPKLTKLTNEELATINIKTTLPIVETSIYASISEDKIRKLVHTKEFTCFKNGNKWCINREMLNECLKKISVAYIQL